MPIEFKCSSCNSTLKVPDKVAGRQAKCPKCSSLNVVPEASSIASAIPNPESNFTSPVSEPEKFSNPYASGGGYSGGGTKSQHQSLTIRSIDVGSMALISGGVYGLIGLVAGLVVGFISILGGAANQGGGGAAMGIGMGIASVIFLPVFYGILGLIGGAIMAVVFNLVSRMVGGVKMKVS